MAAIDITGAGGGGGASITVSATSPVVSTLVGSNYDISLDQTQFKTINGNSIFGAGNIVISTGLTNWTEAFASSTQATSSFTALNAATNVNAALVSKGTGATLANVPNGAISGGNARGTNATDWQKNRTSANQVASGSNSVISGGSLNISSGLNAVVAGGDNNQATNTGATIGGGLANRCNGQFATVAGGYICFANGQADTVSGGESNQLILLGVGGENYRFIGGGQSNIISAGSSNHSVITGGFENIVSSGASFSSVIGGRHTNAYFYGQKAHANGRFTITGDAQGSEAIYRLNSGFTDAQTKEIFLDGTSIRFTPFTNSALTINFDIVAIVTSISGTATGITVGDMFSQNEIVALKNVAGTTTVVGSHSIHKLHDASMTACDTTYLNTGTALAVNFLGPNFAGGGTVTLRIVVKARIVETRY